MGNNAQFLSTQKAPRDYSLDVLRALGIVLILLAHCEPGPIVFQLRNFCVPLLVVVSALSFLGSAKVKEPTWRSYVFSRVPRLLFPVWSFLAIFFLVGEGLVVAGWEMREFTGMEMLKSFLLSGGIGFVWIFKAYLATTLAAVPLRNLVYKMKIGPAKLWAVGLGVYVAYELAYAALPGAWLRVAEEFVFTPIGFILIFAYGLALPLLSKRSLWGIFGLLVGCFLVGAVANWDGGFTQTQAYKYPPRFYYLGYALAIVTLLYLIVVRYAKISSVHPMVVWISKHTTWIYLWHIVGYYAWGPAQSGSAESWMKFLFLLVFSMGATWAHLKIFETLRARFVNMPKFVKTALG